MCECVRTLVTCWKMLRECWPTSCCGTAFLWIFLVVDCRSTLWKAWDRISRIWLLSIMRLAWTSAACTYFAEKLTTAKRTDGTLYEILQNTGYTKLSFDCVVGLAQLLNTTTPASSSWRRPRNIYSACLSGGICLGRSLPFIAEALLLRLVPQPNPKCWQQWPTDELTPSWKCLHRPTWWKQTMMGFGMRMPKLKMKSEIICRETAPGSARPRACVPYGEPTFKRNQPLFAVLMIFFLGGGGVVVVRFNVQKRAPYVTRTPQWSMHVDLHICSWCKLHVAQNATLNDNKLEPSPLCVAVCVCVSVSVCLCLCPDLCVSDSVRLWLWCKSSCV